MVVRACRRTQALHGTVVPTIDRTIDHAVDRTVDRAVDHGVDRTVERRARTGVGVLA
jgi:hypothetical protein